MFWLNLLAFFLLTVGNCEVLVALVNRSHSYGIRLTMLRPLRIGHHVWMFAFPLLLVWFVGVRGPGLLLGAPRAGAWTDVSPGWGVYLLMCAIGSVTLVAGSVRRRFRVIPGAQLSNHSHTVDIEGELGRRPVVSGRHERLARLPFNENFRLELSDKHYRLPACPPEWDGLSILHVSDLHFIETIEREHFERVIELGAGLNPDLVVFTGDLLDAQECVEWLPTTLGRLNAPLGCYFILGNHDWYLDADAIRAKLAELGWTDVGSRCRTIEHNGRPLAIAGLELPWMGEHPDFSGAPEDAFRLLLSHTPDHIHWARSQGIDLMLSGHNHGGQIVLPVVGPVYSPSRYGCKYSAGVFWEDPTLLYVSRGVSGRHPLRYNCLPEMTKLVLRH